MSTREHRTGYLPSRFARYGNLFGALGLLLGGCIIGTWPTPEEAPTASAQTPGTGAAGAETCDELDNDGDGVVDEGCACNGDAERGCVGKVEQQCGLGVQHCRDGHWSVCENIGPPWTAPRTASVTLTAYPDAISRGDSEAISVSVTATPPCQGVVVGDIAVRLESAAPVMVVSAPTALGSEVATATLPNAFGPGVPAQSLVLRAAAVLDGQTVETTADVPLVEPEP